MRGGEVLGGKTKEEVFTFGELHQPNSVKEESGYRLVELLRYTGGHVDREAWRVRLNFSEEKEGPISRIRKLRFRGVK